MDKQTPTIEWIVTKSDAEWERLRGPALIASPVTPHRRRLFSLWGVTVLCLLLTLVDGWEWHSAPSALSQSATDKVMPQPTVSVGESAHALLATILGDRVTTDGRMPNQEERRSHGLQASESTAPGNIEISRMALQGERATVSLIFSDESGVYRQTHFYEHTAVGWRQIAPDADLWGVEQSLETPYFVYHFRQHDRQAVMAVAPQVDALYTTLRTNFGLPALPAAEKLLIDVSVTHLPGAVPVRMGTTSQFSVPSPAIYLAPVALTDADLLAQSLALPLLDQVLAQASAGQPLALSWRKGLRLWQLWDMEQPLSVWREEIVRWVYQDLPRNQPGQPLVLSEHYRQLCAAYKLWLPSPMYLDIPLVCVEPEWEERLWARRGPYALLLHLDQFFLAAPFAEDKVEPDRMMERVSQRGQTVALAVLIEYAVVTYGRDRLPALVAGLGQHDTWGTLTPAVYGVSSAEFEAGWQAYVAERYGISLATGNS